MHRLFKLVILALLIGAALLPIRAAQAATRQFPETGQSVSGALLDFWNTNGGLPIFGIPIGDQRFMQANDGGGDMQYFERNRLELHPELAPPYNVLLGRLGDDLLRRQGRDWRNESGDGNPLGGACRRFDETGREVCGPFLQYWQSHGLTGQRLNSYQRSLALFGLPLTGVRRERNSSGDEVLTQWFERARFEYHPDKPNPYKVLLGRLGAEAFDPQRPNGEAAQYTSVALPDGHTLDVPRGFTIDLLATGLNRPRMMALNDWGGVFVAEMGAGRVLWFPTDDNRQTLWNQPQVLAEGLQNPHSLLMIGQDVYIATETALLRGSFLERQADGKLRLIKVIDLPSGSRDLYGHQTRTLARGPDGKVYVSVGSSCDLCVETDPQRATVLRLNPDGSQREVFARGLRNTVGLAFRPTTDELWGVDNGRNGLGDQQPPEELNRLVRGGDYGWPYCHGDRQPSPEFNDPARCSATIAPAWKMQAHTAPLGLTFYLGTQFPPSYQGDAIVARHGTAGSEVSRLAGYDLVRIRFKDGQPVAEETLVRGWLVENAWWGRPVGLTVDLDGSLLISDDGGGRIYRLRYTGH